MGANEALHIATDHLHVFAYIAGFSDTMSGLSTVPLDPNTAIHGVLKDGAAFNENVKLLWLGIGTGHRRQIHLREPSALSARCSTRPGCQVCLLRLARHYARVAHIETESDRPCFQAIPPTSRSTFQQPSDCSLFPLTRSSRSE